MDYEVHVTGREGRWWAVEIPQLGEDAVTQATRLADVVAEARDYIAVALDVRPSTIDVRVIVDDTPHARDIQVRSEQILTARRQAQALEAAAVEDAQALARELTRDGVPLRDIATLVGVSFQRVSQLAGNIR
jgi:ribulose 1,5-bisphosphate synthetase/thiazole synthase